MASSLLTTLVLSRDPHSNYRPGQPVMTHIDWTATVDFENRMLGCIAIITFDLGGRTCLDTRDLTIEKITNLAGHNLEFELGEPRPVIGQCLTITVPDDNPKIMIYYTTAPTASALQWLTPAQTLGKVQPYLFSQGEPHHTRSFLPCQDTPGIRVTFKAAVTVPKELKCVMGAAFVKRYFDDSNVTEVWKMTQPVPSYLIAFAVGDLVSRDIDSRCCVWSELEQVDAAATEFAEMGNMLIAAERVFGKYDWERWDVLVLPLSFPYGGMENPRLTFVTPTVIAGDKSGVSLLVHELAHAWTGNLITNARWSDFWTNEGWTTYLQFRITELMSGSDVAMLEMAMLQREMVRDFERYYRINQTHYTWLAMPVPGDVDPDDIFCRVPYCKGALFLMMLEQHVGRQRFDMFIQEYIKRFRFTSIKTNQFLDFVEEYWPGVLGQVQFWHWVYGPGLPANAPAIESPLIDAATGYAEKSESPPTTEVWHPYQWVLYLEMLSRPLTTTQMEELEAQHHLASHRHIEVRWAYLLAAIEARCDIETLPLREFMAGTGRLKHLDPLFTALGKTTDGLVWAQAQLEELRSSLHPIAVTQLERVLREAIK